MGKRYQLEKLGIIFGDIVIAFRRRIDLEKIAVFFLGDQSLLQQMAAECLDLPGLMVERQQLVFREPSYETSLYANITVSWDAGLIECSR